MYKTITRIPPPTISDLKDWKCFDKHTGRLVIYPTSLTYANIMKLVRKGQLVRKFYPDCFAHDEFYLSPAQLSQYKRRFTHD